MTTQVEKEFRAFVGAELRVVQEKGRRKIVGYASRFNSDSVDMGFIEQVAPGAFKRTLAENADVRALVDHNPTLILGRSKAGTLTMKEDEKGLHISIDPPDTQAARDIMQSIDRGDIDAMSFGFTTRADAWDYKAEPPRRTLTDVDLFDVSVVTFPAYPETSVALRSLEHAKAEGEARARLEKAKEALDKRKPKA
jgi:hypothetical protein